MMLTPWLSVRFIKFFEKIDLISNGRHSSSKNHKYYKHYRELINRKIINQLMASIGRHATIRYNISNKEKIIW